MSNYRRLISYIYAYEGKVKGKNIGFAKLESRNGQCKVTVSVKKVYVGGNDLGVYLLSGAEEILLGTMFIRNGAGEFRTLVSASDVEGSGCGMDQCYGLTIHEAGDTWQSYTTIWEDAVAHAAEIELANVTSEQQMKKEMHIEEVTAELPIAQEIELELEREDMEMSREQEAQTELKMEMQMEPEPELQYQPEPELQYQSQPEPEEVPIAELAGETQSEPQNESVVQPVTVQTQEPKSDVISNSKVEDEEVLKKLEQEEQAEGDQDQVWEQFRKMRTKIQAFDYEHGCEILTIKPQDIGLLPRETWVYGNNSFMLHGYYNYRYLILVKLNNPNGAPRYLLGVPGHYYSNEKYMASMFGFPNFVLSKKQPMEDCRFGYWYTDVTMRA